jgi:transcriptional repressor NrdR
VIKRDGNRELFNRDKLLKGIQRATEKTRVTTVDLELIVASIEAELQSLAEPEVYSKEIGELVMQRLSVLDEVAYVRFASVYRQFKDIASFERELLRIKQSKKSNN